MSEDLVNIVVDGVPMTAKKGEMVIRVTDTNNVYIPRFCYHDKLPVAANCRMCLVEIEKAPKPMPACATPVAEGMKIFTRSPKAIAAQKATMEFLLINHPLDCPICDQGGECELQDLAMGFGRDISRFTERKRVVKDRSLGPLVSTDMTRCIHCTRCVRFGQDVAGIQELGTTGRGEHMEIGTFIEKSVDHELSGNIIDLCPVGALNSKPFRFRARSWEMTQHPLVSPHDGLGSNLFGHVLRGRLMRVVPRQNDAINETWISDRDRFSYEGVYSDDRLAAPMLKQSGAWRQVDWQTALDAAARALQASTAEQLAFLASPSSTLEEFHLLARIARALGSANLDHRLRQSDFSAATARFAPGLGLPVAVVDSLDGLLIIGSNLRHEIPVLANRVRKAAMRGARIGFLNPARFEYLFPVAGYIDAAPSRLRGELAAVLAAAIEGTEVSPGTRALVADSTIGDAHRIIAAALKNGSQRAVWLGALAQRHPDYSELLELAAALAQATGASLGVLAEGANACGAWIAGVMPDRGAGGSPVAPPGRNAREMFETGLQDYLLLNVEPWADSLYGTAALKSLRAARSVIAVTPYASEQLREVASVLLPSGSFAETSGTYVNLEGSWQSFAGAAQPVGEARPAWKLLRVLANHLQLPGFEYQSSEEVREELRASFVRSGTVGSASVAPPMARAKRDPGSAGLVDVPIYQIDALVRRAASLQRSHAGRGAALIYTDAAQDG